MADEPTRRPPDTAHIPLPYHVRLRGQTDDDSEPFTYEYYGIAYSLFEAVTQALFQAGGTGLEDVRYKVEIAEPDLQAYLRTFEPLAKLVKALKPRT